MTNEERIVSIAEKLDRNFWGKWIKLTEDFPDITEAAELKFVIMQVAIATIISNYILGFEKKYRSEELELLISNLRTIEANMRDMG
jgi:hypothetical protein